MKITNRRIMLQMSLGIKQVPVTKTTYTKKADKCLVVEHLSSKHEALSSTPKTTKEQFKII
jgi:hypothetical protein